MYLMVSLYVRMLRQIYLQSDAGTAIVLISATYDDNTGVLTLDGTSADVTSNWEEDFAMAHPDGSVSRSCIPCRPARYRQIRT